MIILRIILIPFSIIYAVIIFFRNKLYDYGIFKTHKLTKPVVSVGNITAGGAGKTPLTILIAEYYLNKGNKTGIVSRGYKRKTDEVVLVSNGKTINTDISRTGDEPVLIADKLIKNHKNNFSIASGCNRAEASNFLINKFNPGIIILDDAFQHRKIFRDLDIVIVDASNFLNEKFLNTFTLPSGMLREIYSGIKRADLIIQNNKDEHYDILPWLKKYGKDVCLMRYKTEYFMDNKNRILNVNKNKSNAIVFSGIADNTSFLNMISKEALTVNEIIKYPDHYYYTEKDIELLTGKLAENEGNLIFITTEKDFMKLKHFEKFVDNYPVYFLKLKTEILLNENCLYSRLESLIK